MCLQFLPCGPGSRLRCVRRPTRARRSKLPRAGGSPGRGLPQPAWQVLMSALKLGVVRTGGYTCWAHTRLAGSTEGPQPALWPKSTAPPPHTHPDLQGTNVQAGWLWKGCARVGGTMWRTGIFLPATRPRKFQVVTECHQAELLAQLERSNG